MVPQKRRGPHHIPGILRGHRLRLDRRQAPIPLGTAALRFRDLTGLRQELADLRQLHDRLDADITAMRAMLAAAPMPVWLRDDTGALVWVNQAYAAAVEAEAPATAIEGLDGAPWKRLPGNRLVAVAPLGAAAYDVPDPALAARAGSTRTFAFGTVLSSPLSSRTHRGVAYWQLQLPAGAEPVACRFHTSSVTDGYLAEDGLIRAADGRLLVVSRQLALAPKPRA